MVPYKGISVAFVYTDEEFDDIKLRYQQGETLDAIQLEHNTKSVASIRMKLVKAGVYQAKKAAPKSSTTKAVAAEKVKQPTTKAGMLAAYQAAEAAVGLAPW